jgi:hypothetical protein
MRRRRNKSRPDKDVGPCCPHKKRRRKIRATPILTARREEEGKGQGCGLLRRLRVRSNRKRNEKIKTVHSS